MHSTFFSSLTAFFLPSCPFGITFSPKTEYPFKNRNFPLISSHHYKELWHSGFLNLQILYFLSGDRPANNPEFIFKSFWGPGGKLTLYLEQAGSTWIAWIWSLPGIFSFTQLNWDLFNEIGGKILGHSTIFCYSSVCK